MQSHEAVRILMQSPFYFRLDLLARKTLVVEFCATYDNISPPLSVLGRRSLGPGVKTSGDMTSR